MKKPYQIESQRAVKRLEEMAADLAAFRLDKMKLVIAREWDCPFNWKVLVENFMESYHHLGIHHKTLQPMMPARDTWTEQERRHYVRSHLPYKDSVREAIDSKVFFVMIGLSGLVILLIGSVSYKPVAVEDDGSHLPAGARHAYELLQGLRGTIGSVWNLAANIEQALACSLVI